MKILFIDETNRFQSKVAEAIFNKMNSNNKIIVKSAGLHYGGYYLDKKMLKACEEMRIKIDTRPVKLTKEMWNAFDFIITTSESVKLELTQEDKESGKTLISWDIEELNGNSQEDMNKVIRAIAGKVRELVNVV
jgi:protein-tyrosine-phosphatase